MRSLETLSKILIKKKVRIITVESCTGGLLASSLNSVPGSSCFYEFGIVCYSNTAKQDILKISEELIQKYGAVSQQVADKMNSNVKHLFDVKNHLIVSITGIAGPTGGSDFKPIGTTFITIFFKKKYKYFKVFSGKSRNEIQSKIVKFSIREISSILKN